MVSDTFEKFKTTYLDNKSTEPQTMTVNHQGTLTIKGEGDSKGQTQLDLSNPNTGVALKNTIEGGTSPSAATGRKN